MIQDDSYDSYDSDEYISDYEYAAATDSLLKSCDGEMNNTDDNSNQQKDDKENCHNIEGNDEMTKPETQNIDDTKTEGNMGTGSNQLQVNVETASSKTTAIGMQNENENCEEAGYVYYYTSVTISPKKGADPSLGADLPLIAAANLNQTTTTKMLLEHHVDVNKKNSHGNTALTTILDSYLSLSKGHRKETVYSLLNAAASVNITDSDGKTPLVLLIKSVGQYINNTIVEEEVMEIVSELTRKGADPNSTPLGEDSALIFAVENMFPTVVQILLESGADTNHIGQNGQNVLHSCFRSEELAIQNLEVEGVEKLLSANPDIVQIKNDKLKVFEMCIAIDQSIKESLKMLDTLTDHLNLDNNVDAFFRKFWKHIKTKNVSSCKEDLDNVTFKILSSEEKVHVNLENNLDDSPLIYFCQIGCPQAVKMLLVHNADVNHVGKSGTALHYIIDLTENPCLTSSDNKGKTVMQKAIAILSGNRDENLRIGYQYDASVSGSRFKTVSSHVNKLLDAALDGGLEFLQFFVDTQHSLNRFDSVDNSILLSVLTHRERYGHAFERVKEIDIYISDLTSFLIKHGACCVADKEGNEPLHIAAEKGYLATIDVLLKLNSGSIYGLNKEGQTALHICLKHPKENVFEIVKRLFESRNSKLWLKLHEVTVLYLATVAAQKIHSYNFDCQSLTFQLVELLLENGADPNNHSEEDIPLLSALKARNLKTSTLLLEASANVNATNRKGESGLHIVLENYEKVDLKERYEITALLVKHGSYLNAASNTGDRPLDVVVQNMIKEMTIEVHKATEDNCRKITVDLSVLNLLVCGGADLYPLIAESNPPYSGNYLNPTLPNFEKGPKSLAITCRKQIRHQLLLISNGTEIETKISTLPLPVKIKHFLSLKECIQENEIILLENDERTETNTVNAVQFLEALGLFGGLFRCNSNMIQMTIMMERPFAIFCYNTYGFYNSYTYCDGYCIGSYGNEYCDEYSTIGCNRQTTGTVIGQTGGGPSIAVVNSSQMASSGMQGQPYGYGAPQQQPQNVGYAPPHQVPESYPPVYPPAYNQPT
ncbi:unnamed protein product [Mytilus edulis]|uniref:SOCS box domain-containing protein n=1 Tax=Mytilus edulis TaxID=6550 RepID=A0A8S3UI29_MYTED|nr:unnamed protein product [Mytilus edulis]